jgi:HlyD family type I secretion membrane fusion protein
MGIGGWSVTAPLSSGVIAPGVVVFEGRRQSIQHLEGGIIAEIHVREGSEVERGDLLFRLDSTQVRSRVARIRHLLVANEAQSARLVAEVNEAKEVVFPDALVRDAELWGFSDIIERERAVFNERRRSLAGQIELLEAKESQFLIEISGLDVQEVALKEQIQILDTEIAELSTLLESELVPRARVTGLEREAARLRGLNGEIVARRSRAYQSISESRLQAEQLRQDFRQEVVTSLRETENEVSDLREQLLVAEDTLSRTDIYAPESGRVQNVVVTTLGSVIQPSQLLLEIAPLDDRLIVEARVAPQDIDSVSIGQQAEVRISALNLRMTPAVFGEVRSVSGDRIVDERAQAEYFLVQINILPAELEKLEGQRILAGMPAQVVLPTGERTLIDYLISPLTDAMSRGLLER